MRIGGIKNHDVVHTAKSGEDLRSLRFGDHGTSGFDPPHGCVAIESHDQAVPQLPGLLKKADVTDVEEIEAAVGKHDALSATSPPLNDFRKLRGGEQFLRHSSGSNQYLSNRKKPQ